MSDVGIEKQIYLRFYMCIRSCLTSFCNEYAVYSSNNLDVCSVKRRTPIHKYEWELIIIFIKMPNFNLIQNVRYNTIISLIASRLPIAFKIKLNLSVKFRPTWTQAYTLVYHESFHQNSCTLRVNKRAWKAIMCLWLFVSMCIKHVLYILQCHQYLQL